MRTITYYLATNQVVESDAIYPNAFSADDNTTQLVFDYTGTACATWDKWLDLTMSDYTKDVQSLGTGTVVTFNLGAEHTKKGLLQVNPYAKNGTDKHGFPIYKLTIERQLNNSTVDASAQQSMIDYFDDRLAVKAVSATTLAPGESATASVTTEADGTTYVFGIPQGAQGIQGIQGEKGDMGEVSTAQLNAGLATKADKLNATNLVTNGDFSNGTTGWTAENSTISVSSNTITITGDGTNTTASAYKTILSGSIIGHKYYVRFNGRVTNSIASYIRARVFLTSGVNIQYNTPLINTWYGVSNVIDANASGNIVLYLTHGGYVDNATQSGKVGEFKYVSIIDLTAIFGAGKEPSAIQMDNMLSTFTNSWFNGTAELVSIANLAQLKADKTQEAWITPTLINSWATFGGNTPQYYKDNFGRVHIKGSVQSGTVSTVAFVLPVGYRPTQAFQYVGLSSGGTFGRVSIDSAGNLTIGQFGTYLNFDGVSFRSA